ncbi:MAG: class I SAM-dependent methyltransferase [Planctomycetota bacterium]
MTTKKFELIAACAFGLEAVVKRELAELEIESSISGNGRIHFSGTEETIALTNLWLRTADRILVRIADFPAADFDALFESTRNLNWGEILPADASFPVTGRSWKSKLESVPACQRAVKRAIVDAMRRDHGVETLPEDGPVHKIDIAIANDRATLTMDTTGRSLHRRGYRVAISKAPLKETLAAALIQLSFWKPGKPFIDPFCGSGTLPIEAAMIARNIAPGLQREFAFESWGMGSQVMDDLRTTARAAQTDPSDEKLLASDIDPSVLRFARDNAQRAGVEDDIHFEAKNATSITSKRRFGCLITNPPYGRRLNAGGGQGGRIDQAIERARPNSHDERQAQRRAAITWELDALYESMVDVLRGLPTWSHFFLTAYPGFERLVGRPADRRRKLYNGRIECTYFQFHGPKPVLENRASESARTESSGVQPPPGDLPPVATRNSNATDSGEATSQEGSIPPDEEGSGAVSANTQTLVHADGSAAFGQLTEKAQHQADLFAARLRKRAKHLRRWPTRRGITCFRLYERDVPEIPLVVDRYEDRLHITEYERPHDRDPAQHANWLDLMVETAGKTLDVLPQHVYFKSRQRQRGKTQYDKRSESRERIVVGEDGLKFIVNLSDYIDTGLFLDHRVTRKMVRQETAGKRFLNLFAYTGSFRVYAAAGGARKTTTVDLSQSYLDWARENMKINGFDGDDHQFVASDVGTFLSEHAPGEMYDVVVVDPPTFSNSKRTEHDWNVQHDALPLLGQLIPLVRRGGVVFFSTNFRRFKFDTRAWKEESGVSEIHEISQQTVPEDYRNRRIHRCWRIVR